MCTVRLYSRLVTGTSCYPFSPLQTSTPALVVSSSVSWFLFVLVVVIDIARCLPCFLLPLASWRRSPPPRAHPTANFSQLRKFSPISRSPLLPLSAILQVFMSHCLQILLPPKFPNNPPLLSPFPCSDLPPPFSERFLVSFFGLPEESQFERDGAARTTQALFPSLFAKRFSLSLGPLSLNPRPLRQPHD